MKLVELTGLCGSGKSSITNLLKEVVIEEGCTVVEYDELIIRKTKSLLIVGWVMKYLPNEIVLKLSPLIAKVFRVKRRYRGLFKTECAEFVKYFEEYNQTRSIPEQQKKMLLEWFLATGGKYILIKEMATENEYFIFDEGFFQKSTYLFVSENEKSPQESDVSQYIKLMPDADAVCHVNVDLDVAVERAIKRGKPSRVAHLDDKLFHEEVQKGDDVFRVAKKHVKSKTMNIDNSENYTNDQEFKVRIKERLRDQFERVKQGA